MARLWAALAILAVLTVGFGRLWRQRSRLEDNEKLAVDFLSRLQDYVQSQGKDGEAYAWLTHRANRVQSTMGAAGISHGYKPPFENFMYREYAIILNMLPELRQSAQYTGIGISNQFDQYAAVLQETLIRHQGILSGGQAIGLANFASQARYEGSVVLGN